MFSTADWTRFVDLKSTIENSGNPAQTYPDLVIFATRVTEKHLACSMIHGLAPLPIFEFKFKSHVSDLVNVNDFLNRSMGTNGVRI